MSYAPIVLFVYNRLQHTKKTVAALLKNTLASQSNVIFYSDAAVSGSETESVRAVRAFLKTITGFKSIQIIEQTENQGLANSIISGVTQTVNTHGSVIVMEDDMLTSTHFLEYMNQSLDYYRDTKRVMHIAGWSYPISGEGLDDNFLWSGMNCWGWATWSDRWAFFEKNVPKLFNQVPFNKRREFDLEGRRKYWSEVVANSTGEINSWAVFWYASIYLNSGLCANPTEGLVKNIGLDGSGVHCQPGYGVLEGQLSEKSSFKLQSKVEENLTAKTRILKFYDDYRGSLTSRAIRKLKRILKIEG